MGAMGQTGTCTHSFFINTGFIPLPCAVLMVCGFVLAWQKFKADGDYLADE